MKNRKNDFGFVWDTVVDAMESGTEKDLENVLERYGEMARVALRLELLSREGYINLNDEEIETMDLDTARELVEKHAPMRIVTHTGQRHLDDFVAVALLKERYPYATIEYAHPQDEEKLAALRNDVGVYLVDVGSDYNPAKLNFDHHHDADLPCSLNLVAKHLEFPDNSTLLEIIDKIDRAGFHAAAKEYGLKSDTTMDKLRKTVLLADLNDPEAASVIAGVTKMHMRRKTDRKNRILDDFVMDLYQSLDARGLLDEAKAKIKREEEEFERKIANAEVHEIEGRKVLLSKESFAPMHGKVFDRTGADIIIERNSMNPQHTSVIKNTKKEGSENIDLGGIFKDYPKVFLHATGFIAVVDAPVETVDVETVVHNAVAMQPNRSATKPKI